MKEEIEELEKLLEEAMARAKKIKYSYYGYKPVPNLIFVGGDNKILVYNSDGDLLNNSAESGSMRHLSVTNDVLYAARSGPGGCDSFTFDSNGILTGPIINFTANQIGTGVAADSNNLYYCANRTILAGNVTIRKFALDGTPLLTGDTGGNAQGILPVNVNGTTKVCVTDQFNFKIYDTDFNQEFNSTGGGAQRDLYYNGNTLYRYNNTNILDVDLTTNTETTYKSPGFVWNEFCLNDDYIIIGGFGTTGYVYVYDNQVVGKPLLTSFPAEVGNINSVDLDTDNNIYVCGDANAVGAKSLRKFDINGNLLWEKSFGVGYCVTLSQSNSYKGTRNPI